METSKSNILIGTIWQKIRLCVGILLAIPFFAVTIYVIFTGEFLTELPAFIFILLIDFLAVILIINSSRTNKLLKNISLYSAALSTDPTGSVSNLAAAMNTSEDVVRDNLRRMIAKRYVTNISLNGTDDYIKFTSTTPETNVTGYKRSVRVNMRKNVVQPEDASIEMCTVKCENCGATNTLVKGQVSECEYCGSALKA